MRRKLASKSNRITDSDFYSPQDIADKIEAIHKVGNLNYFECCTEVAELLNIEIESVAKILPKAIKEKLLKDASDLRLLKPEHRITTLPL